MITLPRLLILFVAVAAPQPYGAAFGALCILIIVLRWCFPPRLSPEAWEKIKARYGYRCVACGAGGELTKDHIRPRSKGGRDTPRNVQPLCRSCNSKKGTRTIDYRSAGRL